MNGLQSTFPVVFYFPFRDPSGVSNLFARMALWLASNSGRPVAVIDYADGQIAKAIQGASGISLIAFEADAPCRVPDACILVMQSLVPYTLPANVLITDSTRIVLWDFLYYSLVNTIFPLAALRHFQHRHPRAYRVWMSLFQPGLKHALNSFIAGLMAKGGLVFHDRQIVEQTSEYLALSLDDAVCLPVPVSVDALMPELGQPTAVLRCGWVGRLYDFKVHILIHTLKRLSRWARDRQRRIEFRIVGDGDESWRLDGLELDHEYFLVIREGAIPVAQLATYMSRNFDLAFSMGTSALESAARGIPSVLLDYSFKPLKRNYRFKWLFESLPGDIGHKIAEADLESGEDSLAALLDAFLLDHQKVAARCHAYCREHHGTDAIGRRFVDLLGASEYRWGDVPKRLLKVSLARRLRNTLRTMHKDKP